MLGHRCGQTNWPAASDNDRPLSVPLSISSRSEESVDSVFIHRSRSFCQHRGFGVNVEPVVDYAMQIRIDGQLVWSD